MLIIHRNLWSLARFQEIIRGKSGDNRHIWDGIMVVRGGPTLSPYHCALSENYMTVGKFLAEWVVSVRPWWDMVGWRTREKELARKWRRMVRGELLVRVAVTFQLYLSLLFLKSFYGVSTFTSVCRKSLHFTRYKKTRGSRDIF